MGVFHKWGYPKWLVYNGKSENPTNLHTTTKAHHMYIPAFGAARWSLGGCSHSKAGLQLPHALRGLGMLAEPLGGGYPAAVAGIPAALPMPHPVGSWIFRPRLGPCEGEP